METIVSTGQALRFVSNRLTASGYPFNRTIFQGVNHSAILTDAFVLRAIEDIVTIDGSVNGAPPLSSVKVMYCALMVIF